MKETEKALTDFLNAVIKKDYKSAFDLCTKTWQSNNSIGKLKNLYSDIKITSFKILSTTHVSNSAMKHGLELVVNGKGALKSTANIVCEEWPYQPRPFGDWGVDPASVLNTEKKQAGETPPQKQAKGSPARKPKENPSNESKK